MSMAMAVTPETANGITIAMCAPELAEMRKGTHLNDEICSQIINGNPEKAMKSLANNKKVGKEVESAINKRIKETKPLVN